MDIVFVHQRNVKEYVFLLRFIRVASEDLKNDQLLLIVREQGDVRLASGAGAHGKVREMLNDALQTVGGERRRR
jgi:hypothetical protein